MKFSLPLILGLLLIVSGNDLMSQDNDPTVQKIQTAFTKASASDLASLFHTTIDLEIPGTEGSYRSTQAEIILDKFFKNNPVKSFKLNHQGSSDSGSKYMIGTYTSDKSYRAYVLLKPVDNKLLICNIQLEED